MAKDKAAQQVSAEKVQSYTDAFALITEATGISDVDVLVATFVNAEDENYRLFKYVEELNQEIAKLEEQIAEVKGEIERYKGQGASTDSQRKKILRELEERLAKTEAKAEAYEGKYTTAMKTVNALRAGIYSIFTKIGCATPATREMLGDEGVTEGNMMQYLGIIEQRTNEILQQFAQTHAAAQGQDPQLAQQAVLGLGPTIPAGAATVAIEPPTIIEEEGSDGARGLLRPFIGLARLRRGAALSVCLWVPDADHRRRLLPIPPASRLQAPQSTATTSGRSRGKSCRRGPSSGSSRGSWGSGRAR